MDDLKVKILKVCNESSKNTMMETLEIEYIDVGENFLVGKMPVNHRVHQPDGVLHGGALVALAESVGSMASYIFLDAQNYFIRGIEISANHVKSVKEGEVFAKATVIHKGRTTQLWDIKIRDKAENLLSVCKLTTIALAKK
ncbi:MAG: hotdog fold thioesterase [Maribacter sp.]|nr:hotdog fold thioesterase [Maribacter sp.]